MSDKILLQLLYLQEMSVQILLLLKPFENVLVKDI